MEKIIAEDPHLKIQTDADETGWAEDPTKPEPFWSNLKYAIVGVVFGVVFVKAQIISWFRMQEMFRLQSFFMYGVIGSAVLVGMVSIFLIRKLKITTFAGDKITIPVKGFHRGQIYGGWCFGLGWALTGACPGPLFAQIGSGFLVISVTLLSAIAGTWFYGRIRTHLPH